MVLDPTCVEASGGRVIQIQVKQPNLAHQRANGERSENQSERSVKLPFSSTSHRFNKVQLLVLLP